MFVSILCCRCLKHQWTNVVINKSNSKCMVGGLELESILISKSSGVTTDLLRVGAAWQ